MSSGRATHRWWLPAQPADVFAHLSNPASYVGMTPFVVRVSGIAAAGDTTTYTAVERFRIAGIPIWNNHIRVTMRLTPRLTGWSRMLTAQGAYA